MGMLSRVSAVAAPQRFHAETASQGYARAFWSGDPLPELWMSSLTAAGVPVTPELAMALSAFYSGVTMIGRDLATLPCQVFKYLTSETGDDAGKSRIRPIYGRGIEFSNGIGSLAYMLRWQPNHVQTATEYFLSMVAQYLMRAVAYAEIVSGPSGFVEQLLPRHPDRVRPERLPSGRLRYQLLYEPGGPRYLTQDEMLAVRDLSFDGGLSVVSRVTFGAQAIGTALATQRAAGKFFKSGMTASVIATYEGQQDDEWEGNLHKSISRFAAGQENSFGLMLVPDNVKVSNLAVDPEKAQMMLAQEWGVREVARLLNIPGSKLGIKDAVSYNSQVQAAVDYVIGCLRPISVTFEQAHQRDLILAKDTYFTEFKLEALLRGDPDAQAMFIERLIKVRVLRPSEARLLLNMNPDPDLDRLSEQDFRPGSTGTGSASPARREANPRDAEALTRAQFRTVLARYDDARRCVIRERAVVAKLAVKHASDPTAWQQALRGFYAEHAGFVAKQMAIDPETARGYAGQQGSAVETAGVGLHTDDWEQAEARELASMAMALEAA